MVRENTVVDNLTTGSYNARSSFVLLFFYMGDYLRIGAQPLRNVSYREPTKIKNCQRSYILLSMEVFLMIFFL